MIAKNTVCLWFDKDALDAANFYAKTFPDTTVGAVHRFLESVRIHRGHGAEGGPDA